MLAVPGQVRGKVRWPLWAMQRLPIYQSPSSPSYFEVRVLPFPCGVPPPAPCGVPPPASFVKPGPGLPGGPGRFPPELAWGYQGPPGCACRFWRSCWCPTRGVAGRSVCRALRVVGLVLAPPGWARGHICPVRRLPVKSEGALSYACQPHRYLPWRGLIEAEAELCQA